MAEHPQNPARNGDAAFFAALASRYVLEREIGRGGMGRVYLANDVRHGRPVAIKVLPPDIATAISTQRFLREIDIAARLTHPNILPLHDSGEAAGRLFYVMPFVEGRTLSELLGERGPLPFDETQTIVTEIADALDYAHSRGIVHRDIKPSNILLVAGHPVIGDFGIARAMQAAADTQATAEQPGLGTPAYMAPEQAAGAVVDRRADVYSLGVMTREMLTGQLSETLRPRLSVRWQLSNRDSLSLRHGVRGALARATAQLPAERFDSAGAFARALHTRPTWWRVVAAAAVMIALGTTALFAWDISHRVSTIPVRLSPRRVVVAQFDNGRRDADLAYLGVMAADWITEGLQGTGAVEVVPTATALQAWRFVDSTRNASARTDPVRALAEETSAGVVVTGSYYRMGEQFQIQAQLTDVARGRLLGAVGPLRGSVASPTETIQALGSRVMSLLSQALDTRMDASIALPTQPPSFEAYREFSEGLADYVSNDFQSSGVRFVRAYRSDTSFVTALLMGSISYSNQGDYARADSLLEIIAPSRPHLSPYDGDWFDYRRALMHGDRRAALAAVRALASKVPGTKGSYNLAVEALQNGRVDEAGRVLDSLAPDRGPMRNWVPYWDAKSRVRHLQGRFEDELADGSRARAMYPSRAYALLGSIRALAALNRRSDLDRIIADAGRLDPDPIGLTVGDLMLESGIELRAHGHESEAEAMLTRALAWFDRVRQLPPKGQAIRFARAQTLYALERWRAALEEADTLVAEQPTRLEYLGLAGAAAARLGDSTKARAFEQRIERLPRRYDLGLGDFSLARIAIAEGDRGGAVELLRRSLAEGHEYDLWLHRDVDFMALRDYPPYEALARPVRN